MLNIFAQAIANLKEKNLYRQLVECAYVKPGMVVRDGKKLINFASNDYFALSQNSRVKKSAIKALKKYGAGGASSRYICGNNPLYTQLEKQLAQINNCEDAIVFSSGYQAAIGVIPALVGENDLVAADKLIHSSLLDAIKLSGAKLIRFAHNDIKHCEDVIQGNTSEYKRILIITESVFSMDGDLGNVAQLKKIAHKYGCMMLLDGAHELYNVGAQVSEFSRSFTLSLSKKGPEAEFCAPIIKLGTLSKAIGSLGGYVASDAQTIDYLRNFAKSAIYTTALPPAVLAAACESLKIIVQKNLAQKTLQNVEYFCQLMNLPKPESAIVVIKIGDNEKVMKIAAEIIKNGFLISAIRPPTVQTARLRITFNEAHKKKHIAKLANLLKKEISND